MKVYALVYQCARTGRRKVYREAMSQSRAISLRDSIRLDGRWAKVYVRTISFSLEPSRAVPRRP